ncbi:hypothetical protein GCM10023238_18410 [Streptomyces heliomycini]
MRGTGQIPVYRESTDALSAFRPAIDAVERGECVAFYPEGTLTRDPDGWPMTGKTGAARVALQTKCPVIPVAQWGANELLPPYARSPACCRARPTACWPGRRWTSTASTSGR